MATADPTAPGTPWSHRDHRPSLPDPPQARILGRPAPPSAQATAPQPVGWGPGAGAGRGCPGGCKPSRTLSRPLERQNRGKFPLHKGLHDVSSGHRIRHYGLFAGTCHARNIERVRQALAASEGAPQRSRAEAGREAKDVAPARRCPCCGGRMPRKREGCDRRQPANFLAVDIRPHIASESLEFCMAERRVCCQWVGSCESRLRKF